MARTIVDSLRIFLMTFPLPSTKIILVGWGEFRARCPPVTLPWNEMVGTEFEKIGHVSELDRAGQFTRWVKNHDILVFRDNGTVRAFSNVCPHVGGPVGYHKMRGGLFTCLWHNLQFRASDGQCLTLKHRLREYRLQVEDGNIFVQLVENDAP